MKLTENFEVSRAKLRENVKLFLSRGLTVEEIGEKYGIGKKTLIETIGYNPGKPGKAKTSGTRKEKAHSSAYDELLSVCDAILKE